MKKPLFVVPLMIVLVVTLVLGGCAESTSDEPVELSLASQYAAGSPHAELLQEWADKIYEATDGEVTITIYASSALLGETDLVSGVKAGIADIVNIQTRALEDQFPLTCIFGMPLMPYLPFGDTELGPEIWAQLEEDFPELKAEYADFKELFNNPSTGGWIHMHSSLVTLPEELDGANLLAFGNPMMEMLEEVGASPLFLDIADLYTSLDRGLLDGVCLAPGGIVEMGLYPLLPYHTIFPNGLMNGGGATVMNLDTWNSLSADAQQAFEDLNSWMTGMSWQLELDSDAEAVTVLEAEGHTFYTLTAEEEEAWYQVAYPVHQAYLAELDAQGLPATELYEEILRLAEEYN